MQLNAFPHFLTPSPFWPTSQFKLKVSHNVFKILFLCVSLSILFCPSQMFRGYLVPTAYCLVCKSGVGPLGRSKEGTKPRQADPSPSRTSLWPTAHALLSQGLTSQQGQLWGLEPSHHRLPPPRRPGPELTACSQKSSLTSYQVHPESSPP